MDELSITIHTRYLIEAVKKHRERFEKSFVALMKVYEKKVKKYQEEYAEFAQKTIGGKTKPNDYGPAQPIKPVNRKHIYDFYLKMLQTHDADFITIPENVYRKLYLDNWDWMSSYIRTLNAFSADSVEVSEALTWYSELGGEE